MLRTPALILTFFFALLTAPAHAVVGGFSADDGNQECTTLGEVDWACLPASAGLATAIDASGATDLVFGGGSKESEPQIWDLTSGGTNGKTDLLHVWAAGEESDTHSFLQLAFHRLTGEGDVFLSFELNQSRATWVNSFGDTVPCRTDGDVLVSYEGAGVIVPVLYRWSGSAGPAECPGGAAGQWVVGPGPAATAEGRTNGGAIANALPGPASGSTLAAATFGEASLDLGSVARHVGISQPCEFFTSMAAHSRTSSSISSSMADYVTSRDISLAACGGPSDPGDTTAPDAPTLGANGGCHANGIVTVSGVAEPGSQVQVREGTTTRGLGIAAADGTWSVDVTGVATGTHVYTARAHDAAGNASASSVAVSVDVDATPPVVTVSSSSATVGQVAISGTSDPGATITVRENGDTVVQTVAGTDGTWTVGFAAASGAHAYVIIASDDCADTTGPTASVTVPAAPGGSDSDPVGGTTPDGGGQPAPGGNPGATTTSGGTLTAEQLQILGEIANCKGKVFKTFLSDPTAKRVIFKVDGKTLATVRKRDARKRFTAKVNPNRYGDGIHQITAVLIKPNGKKRTVRMRAFRTCSLGKCVSRRAFKIRVKRVSGDTVVKATVFVNGKRVKVVRGAKRLRAAVVLTGLPRGTFTMNVRATTRKGKVVNDTRRYRTCAPKN